MSHFMKHSLVISQDLKKNWVGCLNYENNRKKVDISGGYRLQNTNIFVDKILQNNKYTFGSNYKFFICMENSSENYRCLFS